MIYGHMRLLLLAVKSLQLGVKEEAYIYLHHLPLFSSLDILHLHEDGLPSLYCCIKALSANSEAGN